VEARLFTCTIPTSLTRRVETRRRRHRPSTARVENEGPTENCLRRAGLVPEYRGGSSKHVLLSKFFDLGSWALNLALSIGIFPYVLKPLQSAAQELKPVMVFIWARILAVDASCQADLLKDNGIVILYRFSTQPLESPLETQANTVLCALSSSPCSAEVFTKARWSACPRMSWAPVLPTLETRIHC